MSDLPDGGASGGGHVRLSIWPLVRLCITSFGLLPLLLAACGGDASDNESEAKVKVVTTLPLFADFVRQIGGDRVEVISLLPSGADPHTWEPAPGDVKKVAGADIAFVNGLDLDKAATTVIEANLPDDAPLVQLAAEVKAAPPYPDFDAGSADLDPHLWLDVRLATKYVNVIMTALNHLDADGAPSYKDNLTRYGEELQHLSLYVRQKTDPIAADRRKLVTAHDAFNHMAAYLGFEVLESVAHAPGQEPSPGDVADIARAIENEGLPAVFGEPQVDEEGRILQQAAEDAGVLFCTLYSDSLDDMVTGYVEMMRFNADELARCLGGDDGG